MRMISKLQLLASLDALVGTANSRQTDKCAIRIPPNGADNRAASIC